MVHRRPSLVWSCAGLLALAGCAAEPGPAPDREATSAAPDRAWARSAFGLANKPVLQRAGALVVADELVVGFRRGVDRDTAALIALDLGGEIAGYAPAADRYVLRFDDGAAARTAERALAARGDVVDVAPSAIMSGTGFGTSPGLLWHLRALGLDPLGSWGSAGGVLVAVLDTGAAYEQYADGLGLYGLAPDLADTPFAAGYDFVNDDEHPNDDQGHGTHVTNVIAASAGTLPLALGAAVLPVKVLDADNRGTELALAEGIRFAVDSGARVINMSLAFPPTYFPSRFLQEAIDHAAQHGVVMVAAVGNHGEDVVAYPAAFRDVIAAGASSLRPHYHPAPADGDDDAGLRWEGSISGLERAPYSNGGFLVDVLAPGGRIDQDRDGDGFPEAILAQTFAPDEPREFEYRFYAGSSQAAAQVSGLAAVMLERNPDLTPFDVRAVLGETARGGDGRLLTIDEGRGFVQADRASAAADAAAATRARPRYFANVWVTLRTRGGGNAEIPKYPNRSRSRRYARAEVEILDEQGLPAVNLDVYGTFTGGAYEPLKRSTGRDGKAVFESGPLTGEGRVAAFQIDAIGLAGGRDAVFDRPRGFVRIDSVSLELLAAFGQGFGTSPGIGGAGGESASAASGPSGAGFGTSPGGPAALTEEIPLTISYAPEIAGRGYLPTLLVPNFSWGMATVPMAVAVDEAWFLAEYPAAAERRAVSYGTGLAGSPLRFDPATSFPRELDLGDDGDGEPDPVALLLLTFASGTGFGTSPGGPIPYLGGTGFGTSPGSSGAGFGTSPGIAFLPIYPDPSGSTACAPEDCLAALSAFWDYWGAAATGAGFGTSPGFTGDAGMTPETFDHLGSLIERYLDFGLSGRAAPVASYGTMLEIGGLRLAPVSPAPDGEGHGSMASGL